MAVYGCATHHQLLAVQLLAWVAHPYTAGSRAGGCIGRRPGKECPGSGDQAVWVILLRPRGLSGSMPRRRDSSSVSSCPGTINPIGASHSGTAGPASAPLLTPPRSGPPPIA